jgi:ABC-type polar amino acid transport system ATPase subunit
MNVQVDNISKAFGNVKVFENISFAVGQGEVVSIKGKSGEGKTTLLRCLNNLETFDNGSIVIDGLDLTKVKDSKEVGKKIGLVFQNYNLFPHLSVKENLMLAPKYLKTGTDDEILQQTRELLETLEIGGKEDMYPYQLSGGQKQRVAIARACMLNPSVLCFDEPTSALDAETTKQISTVIRKLAKTGMSILIVTHDDQFAQEISDRIIKMHGGKIEEIRV